VAVLAADASRLLFGGGPSAVVWTIWPIVVDSVNGESAFRPPAHVREKCRKTFAPSGAYRDAPPAVSVEELVIRVETSLLDRFPRSILSGFGAIRGMAVSCPHRRALTLKTAARLSQPSGQVAAYGDHFVSAVTTAKPFGFGESSLASMADDGQATVAISRNSQGRRHA
jgi:hypothetical protein